MSGNEDTVGNIIDPLDSTMRPRMDILPAAIITHNMPLHTKDRTAYGTGRQFLVIPLDYRILHRYRQTLLSPSSCGICPARPSEALQSASWHPHFVFAPGIVPV